MASGDWAHSVPSTSAYTSSGGSRWSWRPSRRQTGKYASLFLRADVNKDGYIDGQEIQELLDRSKLDPHVLKVAWELADQDVDGYLSFPEFVAFIHLVSCIKKGAPTPALHEGLPEELSKAMQPLYHDEPRRISDSRSRSPSPLPSGIITPGGRSGAATPRSSGGSMPSTSARRSASGSRSRSTQRWSWTPSRRQLGKYASLFLRADMNRDSFVDGTEIKELLDRSKLEQGDLQVAWQLADMDRDSMLSFPEFVAFIHLVSCIKRGAPAPAAYEGLPTELAQALQPLYHDDPRRIDGARSRSPSPLPSGIITPGARTGLSSHSTSRGSSRSRIAWTPSRRQIGKYAALFLRADLNRDGYIDESEVWELMERSKLDQQTLQAAWQQADIDFDNRLSFPEFVAFIHLLSCVKGGLPLQQGLPLELSQALEPLYLDDPRRIHESRSRSPSPLPSGIITPGTDFGGGMNQFDEVDFSSPSGKATGKKKKKKHGGMEDQWGTPPDQTGGDSPFSLGHGHRMDFGDPSPDFQEPRHRPSQLELERAAEADGRRHRDLMQLRAHFEALLDADRAFNRHLREDLNKKEAEAQQSHQDRSHVENETLAEEQAIQSMMDQRRQLEEQVERQKQHLADLREQRRAVDMDAIGLRKDREHFAEELAFLQRMLQEEERDLETVNTVNLTLEHAYKALEGHTRQLELQRKELQTQVAQEHETAKQEERENAELHHKVERLHRQLNRAMSGKFHLTNKEQQMRHLQSGLSEVADTNWRKGVSGAGVPQIAGGPAMAKFRNRECV